MIGGSAREDVVKKRAANRMQRKLAAKSEKQTR